MTHDRGTTRCAWALCVGRDSISCLAELRILANTWTCDAGDELWVRGEVFNDEIRRLLTAIPGEKFHILADGQLIPWGSRVPKGRLPHGDWIELHRFITATIPPAAQAGKIPQGVTVSLVRYSSPRDASVLVTTARDWADYAATAQEIRLKPLRFAASRDGRVAIVGRPLPTLAGVRYWVEDGIAVPVGWRWNPPVLANVLRQALQLTQEDLALLNLDGNYERLTSDDLVPATRSAARLTSERIVHE